MSRIIVRFIVCLLLTTATAGTASAHHEAWVLREPGSQCAFESPFGTFSEDNYFDGLFNGASYSRWMSCPVSLAARWASSSPSYPAARWARASVAVVYAVNNQPGTALSCLTEARLGSGTLRFSKTVSTTAGGDQRLMPNSASNWGGDLETYKGDTVRAMDFRCQVPTNYSGVYAYKVRMCIRNQNCVPNSNFGEGDVAGASKQDYVQTSGIACMTSGDPNLVRSELGAKNVGSGYTYVLCPIAPPADDTNEIAARKTYVISVQYKGVTSQFGEPPPTCQLYASTRSVSSGAYTNEPWVSAAFTQYEFREEVRLSQFAMAPSGRADTGLTVGCDLPPGYTIKGLTAVIDIPAVAGGF